jgi:RNA polymerase sigma factor (sigma-70 family)
MAPMARERPPADDIELIDSCLQGKKRAWTELIDRYRRLIYSVPVKMGLKPDQADEVFQDVCVKLLTRLETLRDGRSLPRWLIVTAQRRCYDLLAQSRRQPTSDEPQDDKVEDTQPRGDELVLESERAQLVRHALEELGRVCRELLHGLFYTDPPLSYQELGKRLGRPHGSLGPTRARCLQSLRKRLGEMGFC